MEQKREAEITSLMQKYLPEKLKSKVTHVQFNGKCAYHQEIQGKLLEDYFANKNIYDTMNSKERHQLAVDIAELLVSIHQIPLSAVQTVTQKYAKTSRNENKTALPDFDYAVAKAHILDVSQNKINLDDFKTPIPRDGLALCHNDLHSGNMVIKDNKLSGFIDFGEAGINPRINDFFHLYRLDRDLAVDAIKEYNKLSDYQIDIRATDYQFLSNTGYTLEQRKNRQSFKPEVAKVLKNFVKSYQSFPSH
jgi:thiamine kinase-like enzyme